MVLDERWPRALLRRGPLNKCRPTEPMPVVEKRSRLSGQRVVTDIVLPRQNTHVDACSATQSSGETQGQGTTHSVRKPPCQSAEESLVATQLICSSDSTTSAVNVMDNVEAPAPISLVARRPRHLASRGWSPHTRKRRPRFQAKP